MKWNLKQNIDGIHAIYEVIAILATMDIMEINIFFQVRNKENGNQIWHKKEVWLWSTGVM